MTEKLQALHDCYCRLTQRQSRYQTFEHSWFDFSEAGYTLEDLTVTIEFILRENKKHEWKYSLVLSKLINDLQRFDDLMNEARAKERSRVKPKNNRENILQAFRGSAEKDPVKICQSAKDVLKRIVE